MAATDPPAHVVHHATTVTSGHQSAVSLMEADYAAAHHWLSKAIAATRRQILESAGLDPDAVDNELESSSNNKSGTGEQQLLQSNANTAGTAADHDDKRRRVGSLGRPGGTRSVADESVVANLGRGGGSASATASSAAKENIAADANKMEEQQAKKKPAAKKGGKKKAAAATKAKTKTDADAAAPPTNIDVYSLKVAQLRAELRSRGMDASGLKRDLQARLAEQIDRERREAEGEGGENEDEDDENEDEQSAEEEEQEEMKDGDDDDMYVEENGEIVEAANEKVEDTAKSGSGSKKSASPTAPGTDAVSSKQMAAASDFPGVDVQALSAKKEEQAKTEENQSPTAIVDEDEDDASIGYDDAMEVDSTSAVPPSGTSAADGEDDDDDQDDDDGDVDMEDVPSAANATATTDAAASSSSSTTANRVTTSDSQGPKGASLSPKKQKGIKKMLQATANLFSPSKKNGAGGGKSPKAAAAEAGASIEAEHSSEISDMLVSPIRPDNTTTASSTVAAAAAAAPPAIAPPSETKVKEANNFFSQFTTDQPAAAPPPSKVGSALKTPAVLSGLASAAASTSAAASSAKTSVGSKGSAASASSSQTNESTASKYTSIKSQHRLKELQENAAARKARLAELRAKSKPVPVSKADGGSVGGSSLTAVAAPLTSAAKAKELSTAEKQKEEKRKLLAAQMREKHFAETAAAKKQAETTATVSKPVAAAETAAAAAAPVIPAMSSTPSQPAQQQQQQAKAQQPKLQQQPQQQSKPKTPPQPKTARPEILSPMDTYEMSDRDEDSSDYDSEEEEKPKKRIPRWARKENLIPALERQFLDGPHKMDPDTIFPEVSTCDLESIFNNKKARYKKRTSSANWAGDRVTAAEKIVYSRAMGFGKSKKKGKGGT